MTNEPVVNNMENKDKFVIIGNDDIASEKIIAPRYSYWRSVGRVFFRKKLNIFLIVAFILILLASFVVPVFCPYDPMENVTNAATFNMSPVKAMAYFGKSAPPLKWILGTGPQGNSIFYGLFSSAKTLVIYNIVANVPYLLLVSVLVYVVGSGFGSFIFALTITGWLGIAYFFRTQVMIIRDREYSLASRCLGTPIPRVVSKNILPFLTSVIVTLLATELPMYISMEVYLSFIGIGLSATIPSLGRMISQAQSAFRTFPWEFWPPVLVASMVTIILYLLGQNLADATDPRTHM